MLRRKAGRWSQVLAAAVAAAGIGVAGAWAATIHGTPRADVLRGTARADVLQGLGGNDKLYGLAGNDKLYGGAGDDLVVGGAGSDLLDCGPGRDTAIADLYDVVKPSCEVVKGLPTPPTTTVEPPAPTTTPEPTTTAQAVALPGRYCGFTGNGVGLCFDIGGQPEVFRNAHFGVEVPCSNSSRFTITFDTTSFVALSYDLSWSYEIRSGEHAGSVIAGKADTSGSAVGTLHVQSSFDYEGSHYTCALDTDWTAKLQG